MREPRTGVSRLATVLLWLFIIDLGIAFGAGLYESRIVVPTWIDVAAPSPEWRADVARRDDTGRRFWVVVTTIPLTLLALANVSAAWRSPSGPRPWWLGAAAAALAERVFTLGYFVPAMVGLMRAASTAESVAAAVQWTQLNHLRHVLVLGAWLAALKALSLVYSRTTTHRATTTSA